MNDDMNGMTVRLTTGFEQYCRQESFERRVREIIKSEFFLNELFRKWELDSRVDNRVDFRVDNKVDARLNSQVPQQVTNQLNNVLSGRVATEIQHQLPAVINRDHQMQGILTDQRSRLSKELEETARILLARIADDGTYHEVTDAYREAFQRKGDERIRVFDEQGQAAIREIRAQYVKDMGNLEKNLEKQSQDRKRIESLEKTIQNQENEISWLRYGLYGLGFTLIGIVMMKTGFYLH